MGGSLKGKRAFSLGKNTKTPLSCCVSPVGERMGEEKKEFVSSVWRKISFFPPHSPAHGRAPAEGELSGLEHNK